MRYRTSSSNRRRRGTVYVLVLAITSMLVVLGITSSMLARQQVDQVSRQHSQSIARLNAISALDIVHKQIDGETAWRSTVGNNRWSGNTIFTLNNGYDDDNVSVQTKYIDELDGDIANDNSQPFRVYVRTSLGDAVRVYSVELAPDGSGNLTRIAQSMRQEVDE